MALWIVFAALAAAALAAVLWPLMQARPVAGARARFDVAVYRDQLAEIERDLERGLLAPAEAEAARLEISRRLLAAAAAERRDGAHPPDPKTSRAAFACAAVCIPLLSLGLYLAYGSPSLPDQPLAARMEAPTERQDLAALIARVEARLRQHPQDGEGWDVIAPVYGNLGRHNDAADAYARAVRLLGETPERLSGHGEALVLANNGIVTEEALESFAKALEAEPTLLRPRFWTVMAKEQDGDYRRAADGWAELLDEAGPDAPWRATVEERLRATRARLAEADADASESPERGPSVEDIAAAERLSEDERAAMIDGMVEGLAARLAREGGALEEWLRLVRAYDALGRREDAAKALDDARHSFDGDRRAAAQLDALARGLGL